jgi:hypothetical protein
LAETFLSAQKSFKKTSLRFLNSFFCAYRKSSRHLVNGGAQQLSWHPDAKFGAYLFFIKTTRFEGRVIKTAVLELAKPDLSQPVCPMRKNVLVTTQTNQLWFS